MSKVIESMWFGCHVRISVFRGMRALFLIL